jgi:hypothetical protein
LIKSANRFAYFIFHYLDSGLSQALQSPLLYCKQKSKEGKGCTKQYSNPPKLLILKQREKDIEQFLNDFG